MSQADGQNADTRHEPRPTLPAWLLHTDHVPTSAQLARLQAALEVAANTTR